MTAETPDERPGRHTVQVVGGWLLLALVVMAFALPRIEQLGMYYDEAFMAQQARDFVEPSHMGSHPGSVRSVSLFGRPFPVRNAAYLGSLKSQLLIPSIAIAGSSPFVVRTTTLATALLALLLGMLWSERLLGRDVAIVGGLLVATDPSFYFFSQFEWGPFTTNLLCRMGGLWLLTLAWQNGPGRRSLVLGAIGGAAFGLGVFSRVDFALVLAAFAIALLVCRPDVVRSALGDRRPLTIAVGIAMLVAAAPMLMSVFELLTASAAIGDRGDLGFKWQVLRSTLEGSQFYRVVALGGRFEEAITYPAPSGGLMWMLLSAAVIIALKPGGAPDRSQPFERRAHAFLLISALLIVAGMLLMPGAVRAHHQLNSMPLLQMIVAAGLLRLWRFDGEGTPAHWIARGTAVLALAALVVGNLHVIGETRRLIDQTGGKGRFSHALNRFADEVDMLGGQGVVSLDWGFHEPLLFLTRKTRLHEAIWTIPKVLAQGQPWVFEAGPETWYLVHEKQFDLFGLGPKLIRSAHALAPGAVEIDTWRDGAEGTAFVSVRILRRHRLVFTGEFEIQ